MARILCRHEQVYPCPTCIEENPEIRAEISEREAQLAHDQQLARARVTAQTLRNKLVDGDWVAGFECKALDSTHAGQRMLLVFDREAFEGYLLGMQAPDTKSFGPGWKFRLDVKTDNADDAAAWLHRVGDYR
jgi:hypothetical protein